MSPELLLGAAEEKNQKKSHEPSCSIIQRKVKERVQKHRPICTWVPPGLSGELIVCVLYLFLLPARGHESPDPSKKNKRAFHWLLWRCTITASDCSADQTEKVPSTKNKRLFLFLEQVCGKSSVFLSFRIQIKPLEPKQALPCLISLNVKKI